MGKAADRLAELLEQKEQELDELKEAVQAEKDDERWRWARHCELPKEQTLPVPRLEIWYDPVASDTYERVWVSE